MTAKPEAKKYREFLVPAEWQIGGPSVTERGDQIAVSKQAYDDLKAQADELNSYIREVYEDYYRYIDKHDIPVTKEYTECIAYLSKALQSYEKFKKGINNGTT